MIDVDGGAYTVLLMIVLVVIGVVLVRLAEWLGWCDDPDEWEHTPGGRNDRIRLLEDEVR